MAAVMLIFIGGSCLYSGDSTFSATYLFNKRLAQLHKNVLNSLKKTMLPSLPEPPPIILLWTPYFTHGGSWLPSLSSLKCPVSDCVVTHDRKLLNRSAAVIFHWRNVNVSDLPVRYSYDQRWILFNKESPPHTPMSVLDAFSGEINWTITYRKDSDIHAPYGWIARREIPGKIPNPPLDRRLVCWLVSNCNTPSGREEYVEILKAFIPVDIYGKCGYLRCPFTDRLRCYDALSRRCKFYLSFENSICKDYVTEKLFNAMLTDMVPVVMGGEDYKKALPPNSYIDALSFDGPEQLAKYLQMLDKNHDRYLSYLSWKKDYEVIDGSWSWSCELCRKLHTKDQQAHSDLHKWWYKASACASWYDLFNSILYTEPW